MRAKCGDGFRLLRQLDIKSRVHGVTIHASIPQRFRRRRQLALGARKATVAIHDLIEQFAPLAHRGDVANQKAPEFGIFDVRSTFFQGCLLLGTRLRDFHGLQPGVPFADIGRELRAGNCHRAAPRRCKPRSTRHCRWTKPMICVTTTISVVVKPLSVSAARSAEVAAPGERLAESAWRNMESSPCEPVDDPAWATASINEGLAY